MNEQKEIVRLLAILTESVQQIAASMAVVAEALVEQAEAWEPTASEYSSRDE